MSYPPFIDTSVSVDINYYYLLGARGANGEITYHGPQVAQPYGDTYHLSLNISPNIVRALPLQINYSVPGRSSEFPKRVSLKLYDL